MTSLAIPGPVDVLNTLPVALLLVDGDQVIRESNAAAESLFNMSSTSLSGRRLADALQLPARFEDADGLARGETHQGGNELVGGDIEFEHRRDFITE